MNKKRLIQLHKLHEQAIEAIKKNKEKDSVGNNPYVTIQLVAILKEIIDLRSVMSDTMTLDAVSEQIKSKLSKPKSLDELPLI